MPIVVSVASALLAQTEPLPPLDEMVLVVTGAMVCGILFLGALFSLMAIAGEMRGAGKAAFWLGIVNILPAIFWTYTAMHFESIFGVFAFVQLVLALVTTAAGYRDMVRKKNSRSAS